MSIRSIYLFFKQKKFISWLILMSLAIFILGLAGYLFIIFGGKLIVDEEKLILPEATVVQTEEGEIVGKLYSENRKFIAIDRIPKHVQEAFIAVEDRRFHKHSGIDFRAVLRAVYRDVIAFNKVEGASTITQQLAKNLFLSNDKTWMRKTKEVMAAIYLERNFSKSEILELYLNAIYFGDSLYGLEAAAEEFFSKSAEDLSIEEGALIAGLVKAPNFYSPIRHPERAIDRRNIVLQAMNDQGFLGINKKMQAQGKTLGLNVKEYNRHPSFDSYLNLVLQELKTEHNLSIQELKRGGYQIITNINPSIQEIAYNKIKKDTYFPGNTEGIEGSFLMVEAKNGKIVAAIGGRNYELGDLNRTRVKRQPGSILKPLAVYGPALMKDEYKPYTMIKDQEIELDGHTVTNADQTYDGLISIYDAIKHSKNTSAVWLLDQIGIDYSKDYLNQMNIKIPDLGLSIALGGLKEGITPIDIVAAYRTFAESGNYTKIAAVEEIYDRKNKQIYKRKNEEKEVFSPQVAWEMTQILKETVEQGTARAGEYKKDLAGKTGSTEHPHVQGKYKDAWFVGYTPDYINALWMGYDISDEEHYLEGGSRYPTILVKDILTEIDKLHPFEETFKKPSHLDELPKPIVLDEVKGVSIQYTFGGFSLVKGKISWEPLEDDRVVYRIYKKNSSSSEKIGEVQGEDHFIIDNVSIFKKEVYFVVPYDPLADREGEPSKSVQLSL